MFNYKSVVDTIKKNRWFFVMIYYTFMTFKRLNEFYNNKKSVCMNHGAEYNIKDI